MRQILWGLFKKVVIADNSAQFVNQIFDNYGELNGSTLLLGGFFFAFQVYGDFSGFSDIAIGTSRLFGFNLKQNFNFPYFSRDIAEFWRRWHISLNTWFRDYLYIPLGGSRGGTGMKIRNIFIIFLVSGFWHGANWTFIFWGFLNACYFLPLMLSKNNRKNLDTVAAGKLFPSIKEIFQMIFTFGLTTIAWIFFRSENVGEAFHYLSRIATSDNFFNLIPEYWGGRIVSDYAFTMLSISILIIVEWIGRNKLHALELLEGLKNISLRWLLYLLLVVYIIIFAGKSQDFIYFQF